MYQTLDYTNTKCIWMKSLYRLISRIRKCSLNPMAEKVKIFSRTTA
jgi:hypothetical protein